MTPNDERTARVVQEPMGAGRQMDAAVARLMGWTHTERVNSWWSDGKRNRQLPNFSTDTAAAFQVFDHLVKRGYAVSLTADRNFGYVCTADRFTTHVVAEDEHSAALAICRVALMAVGDEG